MWAFAGGNRSATGYGPGYTPNITGGAIGSSQTSPDNARTALAFAGASGATYMGYWSDTGAGSVADLNPSTDWIIPHNAVDDGATWEVYMTVVSGTSTSTSLNDTWTTYSLGSNVYVINTQSGVGSNVVVVACSVRRNGVVLVDSVQYTLTSTVS